MFCRVCGAQLVEGAPYCSKCGSRSDGGSAFTPPRPQAFFYSGHTLAQWVRGLLMLQICVSAVSLVFALTADNFAQALVGSADPFAPGQEPNWTWTSISCTDSCVSIAIIVTWLFWIYRVYLNGPALGAIGMTRSPGWAVGFCIIPFVNLVMTPIVVAEIWRSSDPNATHDWQRAPGTSMIGWWWALTIFTQIAMFTVGLMAGFMGPGASDFLPPGTQTPNLENSEIISSAYAAMAVLVIVKLMLFAAIVRAIDLRQSDKAWKLGLVSE